ncbi:MAG: apolipoprotein N-acyltransferase [Armatimonadetes bacterium CG2_30_59_28]|nr:MAG: apolipoprotein N-acyltransferase [Armatimonadetes bacterium CG2_30_59_28]
MALSFFPRSLFPLAWIGLIPLLLSLRGKKRGQCVWLMLLFGVVYHGILNFYIAGAVFRAGAFLPYALWQQLLVSGVAFLGAVAGCCAWPALFGLCYCGRTPQSGTGSPPPTAVALLWSVVELARSLGPFGYTWGDVGYSQTSWLPILQIASVVGVFGISFLVVWVNASIAEVLARHDTASLFGLAGAIGAIALMYAVAARMDYRQQEPWNSEKKFRVRIVQPGLSLTDKQAAGERLGGGLRNELELSGRGGGDVDMIVWPETAILELLPWSSATRRSLMRLTKGLRAWLITGALERDTMGREFNCAVSISPAGKTRGVYRKQHLVPFGEYLPMRSRWAFMEFFAFRERDFSPGNRMQLLPGAMGPTAAAICFESMFSGLLREMTRNGARVIAVLTNDEWLSGTSAPTLHLAMAQMRAVENRRFVIRSANTGISAIISDTGRIVAQLGEGQSGTVQGDVTSRSELSLYSMFGEAWLVIGIALWVVLSLYRGTHRRTQDGRDLC